MSEGLAPELVDRPFTTVHSGSTDASRGLCLALSHDGLGQSGRGQRGIALLLAPYAHGEPSRSVARLTGAWANCEGSELGAGADDVLLLPPG